VLRSFSLAALGIQTLAALALGGYVVAAMTALARDRDLLQARLIVSEGVVVALGLMVPATVLRTVVIRGWDQIFALALLLALRTTVKSVLSAERGHLERDIDLALRDVLSRAPAALK
jgi:uncharacterized membrane protein